MSDTKKHPERQNSLPTKTRKNRSKLLANMIMKAKGKIRRNSSSNNSQQPMSDGSITCLYDIRNKSRTSQSSKDKVEEDSVTRFDDNVRSQPNLLREIGEIEKDDSEVRGPSLDASLQKDDSIAKDGKCTRNFYQDAFDCVSPLTKCTSIAYLSAAVKEILDFSERLQNGEVRLVEMLKKYLDDKRLETELTEVITGHVTLQIKAERHAQNLANDIWLQQAQFYKNQEKIFNDTMKEVTDRNRKLEEENEALTRRNEKMYVKMILGQDDRSSSTNEQTCLYIIERLGKNNEKLRFSNNELSRKTRILESALAENKEQYVNLERQLQNCFCEIQSQKRLVQNLKLDKELETAVLNRKVENTEKLFREAISQGESIIEEMTVAKYKFPSVFSTVSRNDLRRSGNILLDIFTTCKLYIEEMVSHIERTQSKAKLLEESCESNRSECSKLREALNIAAVEIKNSSALAKTYAGFQQEREAYVAKINVLEKEFEKYKQIIESKTQVALEERAKMMKMIEGLELLKLKMSEKDEQLLKGQRENDGLKQQLNGLHHVLRASGAGDVARELASTQEKLSALQTQYHEAVAERNGLIEKSASYSSKVEILTNNETILNTKLKELQDEVGALKEAKSRMKEEISAQKSTLIALQVERKRHLEEKTFLKTVYDKIKSDAVKSEELENTIQAMTKETNRLAVIADYNKNLGEKLRAEIDDRDAAINELRENLRKVNEMQKNGVREKAALCEELTEICSFKDILSCKLEDEMHKSERISESKRLLESGLAKQLESLKSLQNVERNATRKLLCDFNQIVMERNALMSRGKEWEERGRKLESERNRLEEERKTLKDINEGKDQKIEILEGELREERAKLCEAASAKETMITEQKVLRADNDKLRESVNYLKHNMQNMQTAVDQSKSLEVQLQNELRSNREDLEGVKRELSANALRLVDVKNENASLSRRLDSKSAECDGVLAEYLMFKNKSTDEIRALKDHLSIAQKALEERAEKIITLEGECQKKILQNEKLDSSLRNKQIEYATLKGEISKLDETVRSLNGDKEKLTAKILKITTDNEMLKVQVLAVQDKVAEKDKLYRNSLEELSSINEEEVKNLKEQLNVAKSELATTEEKMQKEKKTYAQLEEAHKDLASKLLRAVHMLIDEKLERQSAEAKIAQIRQEVIRRETEQVGAQQKLDYCARKLEESADKIEELRSKIVTLEEEGGETCKKYREQLEEYDKLMMKFTSLEGMYKEQLEKVALTPSPSETEDRILSLKSEIDEGHSYVMKLQNDIFKLQQDNTAVAFEKTEMELRLHELEKRCQLEEGLKNIFEKVNKRTLETILEMKEDGSISRCLCDKLLDAVQCRECT